MPFDPENLRKTETVIALVKSKGVEIAGATILDIGCGTGIYTLPLAREASKVTGVDLSKTMLDRFREEAQKQDLTNWDCSRGFLGFPRWRIYTDFLVKQLRPGRFQSYSNREGEKMEWLKFTIDYGILGFLILLSMIAIGIAIERFHVFRHIKIRCLSG